MRVLREISRLWSGTDALSFFILFFPHKLEERMIVLGGFILFG